MLDFRYGRTGRSLCCQAKLIMALHRLIRRLGKIHLIFLMGAFLFVLYAVKQVQNSRALGEDEGEFHMYRQLHANYNYDAADLVYYKKEVPLIWIGGVPRSGTTLMRAMLDAHPDIRCGEETRVIPRILGMHLGMVRAELEMNRLREAKITDDILDSALGAYILSIIAKHGEAAPRLCNKDPFTLRSMQRLLRIFPNSKFILMVRDGRAVVHSIISRKVTIKGFDIHSYRGAIRDWNRAVSTMYSECLTVGRDRCLALYYEQLVLHPKDQLRRVLRFLEVPWNDIVLHHEKTIGQTGGVSLSRRELSTDQVNKPVNTGALSKWVEHIPADVRKDMRQLAPMLETLGYDPDGYPPNYGTPDKIVAKQSAALELSRKVDGQRNR